MSKNKSRKMQAALRLLDEVLAIDAADPHALPGSVVHSIKAAKKKLSRDIRRRREGREREAFRRGSG